ncbi:hypothetical protein E2C01_057498 [Portunus trituberculatus]|uniref:Uncharacterized protein n=1 Tax=Portunus trituberculatus TaxID=210409 RepID=A0A5B7GTN3_PORTR|nr:hypothetical protein [Portunus trituberculatus]
MKNYQQNAEKCCFSQDCGRTRDAHRPVLLVIQYQNETVTVARRERTELCIRPLISLWC